jgi:hypothetical protein
MSQSQLQTYAELVLEYERVTSELSKLKKEYEENTIIQSMNDMKTIYDGQTKKLEKMNKIIDDMTQSTKAVQLMLKTMIKNYGGYTSRRESFNKYELRMRLEFINEVLTESLKTKSELYYINID